MTEQTLFENFIFENWRTVSIERERRGDSVLSKSFSHHSGRSYYITARFSKEGCFCGGYLTDDNGTAIVNGKGFPIHTFIDHLKLGLKAIDKI